jgi:hypothetical protein
MKIEVIELKPVDPPKEYLLTLSQDELDVVVACLGKTGGYDGPKGWRRLMDGVWSQMHRYATERAIYSILNADGKFPSNRDRVVPEV